MRVGINGMGRIGRLALRGAMGAAERQDSDPGHGHRLEIVHLNEIKGGAGACAHLLEFDSTQGRWRADIEATSDSGLRVGDRQIGFTSHATPAEIPWGDLGVDLVLECSGKFLTPEVLQGHIDRGAKRVIVAAPVKHPSVLNIVYGVNHDLYDASRYPIVTAASCTTNATAIALISPELMGKLDGHAVRAPVLNASLVDCVFEVSRATTAAEVNTLFEQAARGPLAGILGFEARPLVSADYAGDTRSSIVDGLSTLVTDDTMLKIYAWYDNEMAYACRMVDIAIHLEKHGL